MAVVTENRTQSLSDLLGEDICSVDSVTASEDETLRLAGLGLSVGREVRVVKCGEPLIVQVYGTRIGLAQSLAEQVHVTTDRSDNG